MRIKYFIGGAATIAFGGYTFFHKPNIKDSDSIRSQINYEILGLNMMYMGTKMVALSFKEGGIRASMLLRPAIFAASSFFVGYQISKIFNEKDKEQFLEEFSRGGQSVIYKKLFFKLSLISEKSLKFLGSSVIYAVSSLTVKYIAPFLNKICGVRSEEEILRDQLAESRQALTQSQEEIRRRSGEKRQLVDQLAESRQALTQSQEEIRRRSGARRELEGQLAESRQALEETRQALAESRVVRASRSGSPGPQLIVDQSAASFLPLAAASAAPAPAPEAASRSVRSSRSASLVVRARSGGGDASSTHREAPASPLSSSRVEPLAPLQMPQIQQQQQQIQQPPSPIAVASRSRSGSDDASVHPAMDVDQSNSDRLSGSKRAGGELTRPREESVRQAKEEAIFRSASPLVSSSSSSSAAAAAASAAAAHDRNPRQELIERLKTLSVITHSGHGRINIYKQAMEIALRGEPKEEKIKEALEYYARFAKKNAARTLAVQGGFTDTIFGERLDLLHKDAKGEQAENLANEISARARALISREEIASATSATLSGQQQQQQQAQMPASVPQTPAQQSHRPVSSRSESGLFTGRGTFTRTARRVVDALSVVREAADEGDSGARGVLAARPRPSVGTLEVVARSLVPDFQSERNPQTQRRSSRRQ